MESNNNVEQKFVVGMKVLFGRDNGEKTLGEIIKVNPKTVKVKQLEARGSFRDYKIGSVWNVSKGLVINAETGEKIAPRPRDFLKKPGERSEAQILAEIRSLYYGLEPEWLYCDGERSHSEAMRVKAKIEARLKECFKEIGREVSEQEALGY